MSQSSQSQRPSGASGSSSGYRQDYIVRIRYNNTLPPPSAPPKLLDIPNAAFAQYCDTTFISRLHRSMPPTIDIDSELGMPLDLSHTPSVFERDYTVIEALQPTPIPDDKDRALLRPAHALGKPDVATTDLGIGFTPKTAFSNLDVARSNFKSAYERTHSAAVVQQKRAKKKAEEDKDPVRILAAVMRGFDTANPETKDHETPVMNDSAAANAERNWKECRHPTKPHLRPVETYPVLPHYEGTSDTGGYMVFKFQVEPTKSGRPGARDEKPDVALLKPVELPPTEDEVVGRPELFDLYFPGQEETVGSVKRKFTDMNPDADLDDDGEEFTYKYVRRYETKFHTSYDANRADGNPGELALVFHDGNDSTGLQKGAYIYPIIAHYNIRPMRKVVDIAGMSRKDRWMDELEPAAEAVKLKVRGLNEPEKKRREEYVQRAEGLLPLHAASQHQQSQGNGGEVDDEDAPGEEE